MRECTDKERSGDRATSQHDYLPCPQSHSVTDFPLLRLSLLEHERLGVVGRRRFRALLNQPHARVPAQDRIVVAGRAQRLGPVVVGQRVFQPLARDLGRAESSAKELGSAAPLADEAGVIFALVRVVELRVAPPFMLTRQWWTFDSIRRSGASHMSATAAYNASETYG